MAEETHSLIPIPGRAAEAEGGFLAGADKKWRSADTRIADTTSYDDHTFCVSIFHKLSQGTQQPNSFQRFQPLGCLMFNGNGDDLL